MGENKDIDDSLDGSHSSNDWDMTITPADQPSTAIED